MVEKLKQASSEINDQFGFCRIGENVKFETIGKKKHPSYEEFQKNVEIIQDAFKLMSADQDLKQVKEKIKPAMSFYNSEVGAFKSSSKDDLRLRHICLYNQALAYFWVEDFDQAETFAKQIQAKESKDKDAKRLLEDIEYTRASLVNAGRKSRHVVVVGGKSWDVLTSEKLFPQFHFLTAQSRGNGISG